MPSGGAKAYKNTPNMHDLFTPQLTHYANLQS
nr:MAG TPA: hypothetical protein [Caudoviricetes sp.]